ncbi:MAG: glutamine-hydrolyzing GMP synthase, partial [Anaerolineae bacterium]|nr:glutamine-hydrolyzing GMP synthase [Anaerolineae bacterium]
MTREAIAVVDFGSQYAQLIARRVREAHVYCELIPWDAPDSVFERLAPKGFILSGGPASVYDANAPRIPRFVREADKPVLGICYGMQVLAHELGGRVAPASEREYGPAELEILEPSAPLFVGVPQRQPVWMSHGDRIEALPPGWSILARTDNSPIAAMGDVSRGWYGLQFHPEVEHTRYGREILRNFLYRVCGCQGTWTPGSFIDEAVAQIREQVGDKRVICGLSGGVDSAVTAALVGRAVGDQLTCIFVNTGLLRRGEPEQVVETFQRSLGLRLVAVDATEEFLADLAGVTDPEEKRKRIGARFIRVFEREARALGKVDFLAQGTLYPDV